MCNSLEHTDWTANPVQVIICEECGITGCSTGGYAVVSQLADWILWTSPLVDDLDTWANEPITPAFQIELHGSLATPVSTWSNWVTQIRQLPAAGSFPATTLQELGTAWRMEANDANRARSLVDIAKWLRQRLVACDYLTTEQAIRAVEQIADMFSGKGNKLASGTLRSILEVNGQLETLYFDGPSQYDWPALARVGSGIFPAFGREWVYLPNNIEDAG